MKKLLLLFFIVAIGNGKTIAQSFTMQADTVYYTISGSGITNNEDAVIPNSDTVTLHWHVIYCNFPTSWMTASGICDNVLCYTMNGLWPSGIETTTAPYDTTGDFHLQIANNIATDVGCYYVTIMIKNESANDSTKATFAVCHDAAAVPEITSALQEATLYPNPATDAATLSFSMANDAAVSVRVYDVTGRDVYNHAAKMERGVNHINIPVTSLAEGVYYVTIDAAGNKQTQKLSVIK